MATCCFGRARLAGAAALPLLFNFRRAFDLAAAFRVDDFFRADVFAAVRDLAAARAAGFLDFFLAIPALPVLSNKASTHKTFRHCEQSEAIQSYRKTGLLRRFTPRNDAERVCQVRTKSMQAEHAVERAKFGGLDQLGVGDANGIKRPLELGLPEMEEVAQRRKFRKQVVVLPDVGL